MRLVNHRLMSINAVIIFAIYVFFFALMFVLPETFHGDHFSPTFSGKSREVEEKLKRN